MRDLTDAEVRVLRALLAAGQENERERLRQTQLPRSTYHAVRKRAYEEGWVRDRYLPDPLLYGFTHATVALARPYADKAQDLGRAWSMEPGAVVLWQSAALLFEVILHSSIAQATKTAERLQRTDLASESLLLTPSLKEPNFPVYFDYEGLFANMAGIAGTTSYPRGLGGPASVGARRGSAISSDGLRRTTQELLLRPFTAPEDGRPGHLLGPVGLPRSQRRLVEQAWVERRVMPDPARIPQFQGRLADLTVFVRGEFLPGKTVSTLLPVLTEQCRVYPFLLVEHQGKMLLGAQGQSAAGPSETVITIPSRRPVLLTLQEHLKSIEVTQVRAAETTIWLDHRYDRLLVLAPSSPPNSPGNPPPSPVM
ncbi:MAG: hypothetical protein KGJ23_07325 [Euryarchaeota archaeon]|nr:hypothetical protein [Euryarchaeota archaeon]MDE1836411.1 hypothetical protein [Euryarchaeota archaeon]MDE1879074.1 hypothetical protein [Euryarchaeota archaeon]MDE2044159.1 hypothetical protein [Thermoplasmata archaeon]